MIAFKLYIGNYYKQVREQKKNHHNERRKRKRFILDLTCSVLLVFL